MSAEQNRQAKHAEGRAQHQPYRDEFQKLTGTTGWTDITTGDYSQPNGVAVKFTITGTAEEAAKKYNAIQNILKNNA